MTSPTYTDSAHAAISFAEDLAPRAADGSRSVGSEHLLLGVLSRDGSVAMAVLAALNIDVTSLRRAGMTAIESSMNDESAPLVAVDSRLTSVLDHAAVEAVDLGHGLIGTEHLLLGLLREQDGIAARLLRTFGVDLTSVRRQTVATLSQYTRAPSDATRLGRPTLPDTPKVARAREQLSLVRDAKQRAIRDGDQGEAARLRGVEKDLLRMIAGLPEGGD